MGATAAGAAAAATVTAAGAAGGRSSCAGTSPDLLVLSSCPLAAGSCLLHQQQLLAEGLGGTAQQLLLEIGPGALVDGSVQQQQQQQQEDKEDMQEVEHMKQLLQSSVQQQQMENGVEQQHQQQRKAVRVSVVHRHAVELELSPAEDDPYLKLKLELLGATGWGLVHCLPQLLTGQGPEQQQQQHQPQQQQQIMGQEVQTNGSAAVSKKQKGLETLQELQGRGQVRLLQQVLAAAALVHCSKRAMLQGGAAKQLLACVQQQKEQQQEVHAGGVSATAGMPLVSSSGTAATAGAESLVSLGSLGSPGDAVIQLQQQLVHVRGKAAAKVVRKALGQQGKQVVAVLHGLDDLDQQLVEEMVGVDREVGGTNEKSAVAGLQQYYRGQLEVLQQWVKLLEQYQHDRQQQVDRGLGDQQQQKGLQEEGRSHKKGKKRQGRDDKTGREQPGRAKVESKKKRGQ